MVKIHSLLVEGGAKEKGGKGDFGMVVRMRGRRMRDLMREFAYVFFYAVRDTLRRRNLGV